MVLQLLKTSYVFYGSLRFVVMFTWAQWHSYTLFISLRFVLISAPHRPRAIQRCNATMRVQFNFFIQNSLLFLVCYTPSSHYPHWLYHTNSIWWRANTVKLFTVLFSPVLSRSYFTLCSRTHTPYTGCFTTLGHNCRRWFPRFLWSKMFI